MSSVWWVALAWLVAAVALGLVLGPLLRRATSTAATGPAPATPGRFRGRRVRLSGNVADSTADVPLAG